MIRDARDNSGVYMKNQLLQAVSWVHDKEHEFTGGLSDLKKSQKGNVVDWSAKDTFAHMVAWKRRMIDLINKLDRNGIERKSEIIDAPINQINRSIWNQYKDAAWNNIIEMNDEVHSMIIDKIDNCLLLYEPEKNRFEWSNRDEPVWKMIIMDNVIIHPIHHINEYYYKNNNEMKKKIIVKEFEKVRQTLERTEPT